MVIERPSLLFLLGFLLVQSCMHQLYSQSLSNSTDQLALIAFKSNITSSPNQTLLAANWTTTTNMCNWVGVSCSRRRQRVTALNLSYMGLEGTISPHIGNLSFLVSLDLSNNYFFSFLPHEISRLHRLRILRLSSNLLEGNIPPTLHYCRKLQVLSLAENKFSGGLPSQMSYCRELVVLSLSFNKFIGSIPKGYGSLEKLQKLYLGDNNLNGSIPRSLFNNSSLKEISLTNNSFYGNIPFDIGLSCPNLEYVVFGMNKFSGRISSYLSNCSKLLVVDFHTNLLSGPIPTSLGRLKYLQELYLNNNQLTGESSEGQELNFLSSLSNCRFLKMLSISRNPLDITLPNSIGNFSVYLESIVASQTQIRGYIPMEIGSLKGLTWLHLSSNNLSGNIPSTIGGLESLQKLFLDHNKIEGSTPEDICQLKNLGDLDLSDNKIFGSIPNCIANLSYLQYLNLSSNRLESSIPLNLWSLGNLQVLDLSLNAFGGYLSPNMKKSDVIEHIDLSRNQITRNIPSIIGSFESLRFLDLSKNSFRGEIPQSFGDLKGLDMLNLSYNNLNGSIPKSLEALSYLKNLNVSFNELSGEIPSGGPFANFTAESFLGNKALCGNQFFDVPPCPSPSSKGLRVKEILLKYVLPGISSIIIILALVYMLRRHRESNKQVPSLPNTLSVLEHRMISYQELCRGTNNFCESNLLGTGGFGSVYKGVLFDGTIVAVKVLNLQLVGAFKSFDAECKVLQTIRHRNLVKVISTCSNLEFRALVLQYIPNGNLERWLYSHNYCLNLLQRVNIMIDIASVLDYLHYGQSEPVVHCDLKPTNILLDDDMVAHVADFGIAKILAENKDFIYTKTLGTLGYIAPEYGFEGKVLIKCDVYSYGIVLLEMITRKKPIDDMFVGGLTLRQWINESLPGRMMEVVDDSLLRIEHGRDIIAIESIFSSIIELGLKCSEELPDERINIKDVLLKLNKIKLALSEDRNNRGV
ncbi:probable LRR receptor-like serine/threonine-protein kinase At3g47570 isoform X1 [Corylus avellana]|uniref:probable LRR receptor-like serine/threonine-protein kinase At3g47570 isoform X1 n=1 Tax=Corylus avellana TaxID=13451 RepID=UPI00286BB214|nr:probable LRR receptor-like serine/threonine-protein kinase At3g47570 isoform X1 [Corylus avellana]